jgi:hypothetical protein
LEVTAVNDAAHIIDDVPLQDVDLLQRLNQYFATLDLRLRHGQGWVIYNVRGKRSARITNFLQQRVGDSGVPFSHYFLPWRDFALTAYLVQVELQSLSEREQGMTEAERREYGIATRVSRQTLARMVTADLLILNGLVPKNEREIQYLDETIERRYKQRLATILLTPEQPHELAADIFGGSERGPEIWDRLSDRLYRTSLIAM